MAEVCQERSCRRHLILILMANLQRRNERFNRPMLKIARISRARDVNQIAPHTTPLHPMPERVFFAWDAPRPRRIVFADGLRRPTRDYTGYPALKRPSFKRSPSSGRL